MLTVPRRQLPHGNTHTCYYARLTWGPLGTAQLENSACQRTTLHLDLESSRNPCEDSKTLACCPTLKRCGLRLGTVQVVSKGRMADSIPGPTRFKNLFRPLPY